MSELVRYERSDAVSTITVDDGKMNLMSARMLQALNSALDRAQADKTVVLLTGRADIWSAGFDLAVFKQAKAAQIEMLGAGAKTVERLLSFPAPVVAACTGHAIAMGAFLLVAVDVRLGVSNGRSKICVNEVELGLTVPRFAVEVCRQRLSPRHFTRAVLTAEPYHPQLAVEAGFLDYLVPAADLLSAAREKAVALSKLTRESHVATKLRARDGALKALRRAIEADMDDWSNRPA
jgi:enoyl-CoA hydratase